MDNVPYVHKVDGRNYIMMSRNRAIRAKENLFPHLFFLNTVNEKMNN